MLRRWTISARNKEKGQKLASLIPGGYLPGGKGKKGACAKKGVVPRRDRRFGTRAKDRRKKGGGGATNLGFVKLGNKPRRGALRDQARHEKRVQIRKKIGGTLTSITGN